MPIEAGLAKDARQPLKEESKSLILKLHEICQPFIHRVSAKRVREELPDFHDTLLYVQPSADQQKIMRAYDQNCCDKNFFRYVTSWVLVQVLLACTLFLTQADAIILCRKYHAIAPILNHPGCLHSIRQNGWSRSSKKVLAVWDKLTETWRSPKFIILVHILAKANVLGEKTLVYSKCLKTLDLIESLLQAPDWKKQVSSLRDKFPDCSFGKWKKNVDYLRIDGSTESGKRGHLVDTFNGNKGHINVRVFLISSEAGGIGINLVSSRQHDGLLIVWITAKVPFSGSIFFFGAQTAATRVVMMDNHFNPTVANQCLARAHRYGQDKPVHCYRLAIEGTLEAKVYARAANKTGVALGVIDGEYTEQSYTRAELDDLTRIECWATCFECKKKRLLLSSTYCCAVEASEQS